MVGPGRIPPSGASEFGGGPGTSSLGNLELVKQELEGGLEAINTRDDFNISVVGKADPDIFVQDVGPIGLPLSESQAKALIAKAHQAPFGKGSSTIVDTSVRNTWEINPDQFQLRSPQ